MIRAITENFDERMHFNTCISSLMEMTNELYQFDQAVDKSGDPTGADIEVAREAFEAVIRMFAPFAPHMAEELWEQFGHTESLARTQWPEFSSELAREEEIEVAVQVNGKFAGSNLRSPDASEIFRDGRLSDERGNLRRQARRGEGYRVPRKLSTSSSIHGGLLFAFV